MICMGNEQVYEYEYDYKLDSGLTGTVSADIKKKTVTDVIPDCTLKQLEDEWKDVSKDHGNDASIALMWTESIDTMKKRKLNKAKLIVNYDATGKTTVQIGTGKAKVLTRNSDLVKEYVQSTVASAAESGDLAKLKEEFKELL